MITRIKRRLRAFRKSESGAVSTLEFVLIVPPFLLLFMAAFEAGMLMTRTIMLEQAVDSTIRELRIGQIANPTQDTIRDEICSRTVIFPNCSEILMVELQRVNTTTFALPPTGAQCVNRDEEIVPVTTFETGQQNDIMLVRVCAMLDLMFPTTGIGARLTSDGQGGYGIVAVSAFANEPA